MEEQELFEKYYNDELLEDERLEFEQNLVSDPDFKNSYAVFIDMQKFLVAKPNIEQGKKDILHARKIYEAKPFSSSINLDHIKKFLLPIAALFIIGALYWTISKQSVTSVSLYAANFTSESLSIGTKSIENKKRAGEGIKFYNDKNYLEAYPLLDTTDLKIRDIPTVLLGKGISALQIEKENEGRSTLIYLANNFPSFSNDANWHIALSYLKQNNLTETKKYLNKISLDSNLKEKVLDLLVAIEKL